MLVCRRDETSFVSSALPSREDGSFSFGDVDGVSIIPVPVQMTRRRCTCRTIRGVPSYFSLSGTRTVVHALLESSVLTEHAHTCLTET